MDIVNKKEYEPTRQKVLITDIVNKKEYEPTRQKVLITGIVNKKEYEPTRQKVWITGNKIYDTIMLCYKENVDTDAKFCKWAIIDLPELKTQVKIPFSRRNDDGFSIDFKVPNDENDLQVKVEFSSYSQKPITQIFDKKDLKINVIIYKLKELKDYFHYPTLFAIISHNTFAINGNSDDFEYFDGELPTIYENVFNELDRAVTAGVYYDTEATLDTSNLQKEAVKARYETYMYGLHEINSQARYLETIVEAAEEWAEAFAESEYHPTKEQVAEFKRLLMEKIDICFKNGEYALLSRSSAEENIIPTILREMNIVESFVIKGPNMVVYLDSIDRWGNIFDDDEFTTTSGIRRSY